MDEDDERAIELSAIAAIFPELVIDPAFTATLDLPVRPEKPLKIRFQSSTQAPPSGLLTPPTTDSTEGGNASDARVPAQLIPALNIDVHSLTHLPPLKIEITLPDGYPQDNPPNVKVYSQPAWLPQSTLEQIQNRCKELWDECGHDQVVYTFIDDVQQEAEKAFGLANEEASNFALSGDLKLILLDYDLKCKQEEFENETFDCGICLEPKKGRSCHRLMLCGHVFCVPCLQDFYNNCITEGDVDNVKCLDPGCGKESASNTTPSQKRKLDRTLNPSELLQIPIEQAQVQRYVRLKRKKRLEADKNTVYCPRQWCQGAAKSKRHPKYDDPLHDEGEPETDEQPAAAAAAKSTKKKKADPEDIPMAERLCVCEDCGYAFCSVCKKGWHGELANCNPRRQAELNAEEQASLEYLKRFSTPCPTCNAPAQKTHGCNHMICFKCKTHFCYLCSAYLMPDNPYKHFNELKSTCYMRLWELEGGHGADAGQALGGGNDVPAPWEVEDIESSDSEEELEEENFDRFGGDDIIGWDDDTDDEEPAPDQRRADRPHIEIVNFARNGANRRIDLPANAPPPQAPAPPVNREQGRRRRRRRGGNRHAALGVDAPVQPAGRPHVPLPPVLAAAPAAAPDANVEPDENAREEVLVPAAPGQGNNADAALQRFLRLALEDREDEWDSDEEDGAPADPVPRARAGNRREQRRR